MPLGIGYPDPRIGLAMGPRRSMLPNLNPLAGRLPMAGREAPSGPTGLAAFLSRPGLSQALLSTGAALLSQADSPGNVAGALGRALPVGMQAFQQGRQEAEINAAMEGAPPEMQRLLRALPAAQRVPALLSMMQKPKPVAVGTNERLVDPDTGAEVVGAMPEAPDLSPEERRFAFFESLSPEQRELFGQMEAAGKGPLVQVNTGDNPSLSDLPATAQSGVLGAQGVRESLDRFQGYAEEWFKLPAGQRAAGQIGVPNKDRDRVLGNLESVRQELTLNLKNLAELGVLAGPDMDILNDMIGDPTSTQALTRSPEFMLTRIERVREYVNNKIRAFEQNYGIQVPDGGAGGAEDGGAPNFFDRYPNLRPPGGG